MCLHILEDEMKKNICLLLIILFMVNTRLFPQETPKTNFWLNAGLGVNSMNFGANINANLALDNVVGTLKFAGNMKGIFGDSLEEVGFLIGWKHQVASAHFSVSGGIASITLIKSSGLFSKSVKQQAVGLMAELQYFYSFFDFLGIGISAYGNANSLEGVVGVNLNLFLGKLD